MKMQGSKYKMEKRKVLKVENNEFSIKKAKIEEIIKYMSNIE